MNTSTKRKIFIIDDQPVVREGLARIISQQEELSICGEASEAGEALKKVKALNPDLVILEAAVEGANGVDFPQSFRQEFPKVPALVFTTHDESYWAERMLRLGINGYLMKRESGDTLLKAIQRVLAGKIYLSPQLNEGLLRRMSGSGNNEKAPIHEILSTREIKVFELIGQGLNTRKIAEELNMAMKTVETHRQHIKIKLRLKNTVALVQRAISWVYLERKGIPV